MARQQKKLYNVLACSIEISALASLSGIKIKFGIKWLMMMMMRMMSDETK